MNSINSISDTNNNSNSNNNHNTTHHHNQHQHHHNHHNQHHNHQNNNTTNTNTNTNTNSSSNSNNNNFISIINSNQHQNSHSDQNSNHHQIALKNQARFYDSRKNFNSNHSLPSFASIPSNPQTSNTAPSNFADQANHHHQHQQQQQHHHNHLKAINPNQATSDGISNLPSLSSTTPSSISGPSSKDSSCQPASLSTPKIDHTQISSSSTNSSTSAISATPSQNPQQLLSSSSSSSNSSIQSAQPPSAQIKRKFNATLEQKIFILDWHHANGKKQTKTAAHFTALEGWPTITQPLISNWLKDEEKIRANLKLATPDTKRLRIIRHPEVEQALSIWCNQAVAENVQLSFEPIKLKAREFAIGFGLDDNEFSKASTCWIERFLERQGARTIKSHNPEDSSSAAIDVERNRIRSVSVFYSRQDIWVLDETSLYYTMPPDVSVPAERWKSEQKLLTFALCVNSDGSERRPPSVVGKYQSPRSFEGKSAESLGFDYGWNNKACVTAELFIKWMTNWQKDLAKQNRKILLLIDNNPGHIVEAELYPNIWVEFISSSISSSIQPLDKGIIRSWKAHYRLLYIRQVLELYESQNSNPYQINQLQAMNLAVTSWSTCLTQSTIVSCWRQTDLLVVDSYGFDLLLGPDVGDPDLELTEAEISQVLDRMVEVGLLDSQNRMSLDDYLNPRCEKISTLQKFTDQEIISLVKNEDDSRGEDEREDEQNVLNESCGLPISLSMTSSDFEPIRVSAPAKPSAPSHLNQRLSFGGSGQLNNTSSISHYNRPAHSPSNPILFHNQNPSHPTQPASHLNSGSLNYLGSDQFIDDSKPVQKSEVWTVPQVLEALEQIGRFSMLRRGEQEWKDVPQVMSRVAQTLRKEIASNASVNAGQKFSIHSSLPPSHPQLCPSPHPQTNHQTQHQYNHPSLPALHSTILPPSHFQSRFPPQQQQQQQQQQQRPSQNQQQQQHQHPHSHQQHHHQTQHSQAHSHPQPHSLSQLTYPISSQAQRSRSSPSQASKSNNQSQSGFSPRSYSSSNNNNHNQNNSNPNGSSNPNPNSSAAAAAVAAAAAAVVHSQLSIDAITHPMNANSD